MRGERREVVRASSRPSRALGPKLGAAARAISASGSQQIWARLPARNAASECILSNQQPYSLAMEPVSILAIGIDLALVPTEDGGRQAPLLGGSAKESRFTYRPNWGLPGWADGDQTAGPVLGFSRTNIRPGEQVRAILVPLFLDHAPEWRDVEPNDVLRMYEGARICGQGHVRWVEPTTWHMPEDEQDRLIGLLSRT